MPNLHKGLMIIGIDALRNGLTDYRTTPILNLTISYLYAMEHHRFRDYVINSKLYFLYIVINSHVMYSYVLVL